MQTTTLLKIILIVSVIVAGSVFLTKEAVPLPQVLTGGKYQKDSLPHAGKMAEIELETKKLSSGLLRVTDEMMRFEGIISQKEINGEEKTAWLVIKLPSSEFENAVKTLEQIGGLKHSRLMTEDKAEECMKLQTQLEALQESKIRLLSSSTPEGGKKLPEMLQIENKLRYVEKEIGEIKGGIERLEEQTAYGLVFIRMYKKKVPLSYETAFQKSINIACQKGLDNGIRIAGIIVFWALSSMPLLIVILLLWLMVALLQIKKIGRKWRRKNTVVATPCSCPAETRIEPSPHPSPSWRGSVEPSPARGADPHPSHSESLSEQTSEV